MKISGKIIYAFAFVAAGFIFHSCQEDSFLPEPADLKQQAASQNCNECFNPAGPFVEQEFTSVVTWGGSRNSFSKTVHAVVYNTEDHFVIKLKSTHTMADIKIRYPGDSEYYSLKTTSGTYPAGKWVIKHLDLPENWQVCDEFELELVVSGNGPQNVLEIKYELTGICNDEDKTVTDIDGNVYPVVKIGDQYWMAKNLSVTRYRNGDDILTLATHAWYELGRDGLGGVTENFNWYDFSFEEFPEKNEIIPLMGRLYNGYAIKDERGLCPAGWHIPSMTEWNQMEQYLVENYAHVTYDNISFKLRSTRYWYDVWDFIAYNGTDDFGFNAMPAGYAESNGFTWGSGMFGIWWASDGMITIRYENGDLRKELRIDNTVGNSIRCVMD
jgi:uncharacterized protein (TIGR02145 family)